MSVDRVALVACAEAVGHDEDEPLLLEALTARGVVADVVDWAEPGVGWGAYRLAVVRSTWDYPRRLPEFLDWGARVAAVTRLLNPLRVIRWNTDKSYLGALAGEGVPVVPTRFVAPGDEVPPVSGPVVVKPAVSAGARDTARYDDGGSGRAREHVRSLQLQGRTAMVQPYLDGVEEQGETAVVFIGGRLSHGLRKGPLLLGGRSDAQGLYAVEDMSPRAVGEAERAVAERALDAVPFSRAELAYARVDLLPGPDGPLVLEVELTEPSLFLVHHPAAADELADELVRRLSG